MFPVWVRFGSPPESGFALHHKQLRQDEEDLGAQHNWKLLQVFWIHRLPS